MTRVILKSIKQAPPLPNVRPLSKAGLMLNFEDKVRRNPSGLMPSSRTHGVILRYGAVYMTIM